MKFKQLFILGIFFLLIISLVIYFLGKAVVKKEVVNPSSSIIVNKTEISDRVLQVYKSYMTSGSKEGLYNDGYITLENLNDLNQVKSYDPILCTQGGSESPIVVDKVILEGSSANVLVKQHYGGGVYNFIQLTIRLSDKKITSIKCQP